MKNKNDFQPLSPHLTIYKKNQVIVLSILHRISGFILSVGSILIVVWILLIAMGEEYFSITYFLFGTIIGKLFLFLWSFSMFYHLINGIRYLFWSIGYGMELNYIYRSGYAVIFFSLLSTILLWMVL